MPTVRVHKPKGWSKSDCFNIRTLKNSLSPKGNAGGFTKWRIN